MLVQKTLVNSLYPCSHCGVVPGKDHGKKCLIGYLEGQPGFKVFTCRKHGKRHCILCYLMNQHGREFACLATYPHNKHGGSDFCRKFSSSARR